MATIATRPDDVLPTGLGVAAFPAWVKDKPGPDGAAVDVSDEKWFGPDALVYCGPEAPPDDIKIDNPLIIVKVVSPSSGGLDANDKLVGYFGVTSVQHYISIYPKDKRLVHHKRQDDGTILTRIVTAGPLRLDPPGLSVDLTEVLS